MTYTQPTDTGTDSYGLVIKHNASGILLEVNMAGVDAGSPNPSRNTKDAVFQAVVDKMASISGTTLIAARRSINYTSEITPTP